MGNRHVLTVEEHIRGIRAAIASPRTPQHLRSALKVRLRVLQKKLEKQQPRRSGAKDQAKVGLLDWLGL